MAALTRLCKTGGSTSATTQKVELFENVAVLLLPKSKPQFHVNRQSNDLSTLKRDDYQNPGDARDEMYGNGKMNKDEQKISLFSLLGNSSND